MTFIKRAAELSQLFPFYEELVERVRQAGCENLDHFQNGYTFEGGYRLQQNPYEFAGLLTFLSGRGPNKNYVEIGSASGGAGRMIVEHTWPHSFTSIDDRQHPDAHYQDENFAFESRMGVDVAPRFQQFVGNSHSEEIANRIKSHFRGLEIDTAFIDGDHSAEGVKQDFQLLLPYLKNDAWVIFHDTVACPGVRDCWHDLLDRNILKPVVEFIGDVVPLGIGIGELV